MSNKMDANFEGVIKDRNDWVEDSERRQVRLRLKQVSEAWWIYADGYGGFDGSPVVEIEMDHGVLTVRLWADRKEEEATHIISVEGMRRDCSSILKPSLHGNATHWYPDEDAVRYAKGMWPYTKPWQPDGDDDDLDEDAADEDESSEVVQDG
jgi:hypothetical protein